MTYALIEFMFTLVKESSLGRRGTLHTLHGNIQTPFFLPVATGGTMRGVLNEDLLSLGAQVLLANTYHLTLRPGVDIIKDAGGLHPFIQWEFPILTDSGGFQVFSLRHQLTIQSDGVHFRSHIDGNPLFLGPTQATEIQLHLGSDIIMCFDECPPSTAKRKDIESAVDRTLHWAKTCKDVFEKQTKGKTKRPLLFGIIQGGLDRVLRKKCTDELLSIGFDGYAIGGLAVGESEDELFDIVASITPLLPKDAPRYLMGVGDRKQIQHCITLGIDMFDSVLPMREARHGTIHLSDGSRMRIISEKYKNDHTPIDLTSPSSLSHTYTKSALNYFIKNNERSGETIACIQNMAVMLQLFANRREEIEMD